MIKTLMSKPEQHILKSRSSKWQTDHILCKHDTIRRCLILFFNLLILTLIVGFSLRQEINETRSYVQANLNQIKKSTDSLAYRNKRYAKTATKAIANFDNRYQKLHVLADIHYYPKLREFGFNRGIYPNNLFNGSLVGPGFPNQLIQKDTHLFAVLDELWAEQQTHPIVYNYYYVSHALKYFYLSSKLPSDQFNTTKEFFSTDLYRNQRSTSQPLNELQKGMYYTYPYLDFFSKEMVVTIKSPVYKNNKIVGDIGVDIPVKSLIKSITLPPKLKSSLNFYLYDSNTEQKFEIYNGYSNYLLPSIPVHTSLNKHTLIFADISPWFFVSFAIKIMMLSILLLITLNYMNVILKRHKFQKQRYQLEAYTDLLTGLFNRRVMDSIVKDIVTENNKNAQSTAIIVFDANDFKIINDTYGHDIGDLALKHISSTINDMTRDSDVCIRLGGDEFCIVLPSADLEQALLMADRLELAIFSGYFCHYNIKVSISTGCTVIEANENLHDALVRADQILYKNKENKAENKKALQQQLKNYIFKSPPNFPKNE
ncbi:hypothetical protein C0W42_00775 [Photobacterium kishitanii]|nr:hypothetical protein C0W42_00775 [Photobacterium kishitanii]PSV15746.1 hypothetical protein C0W28_15100 [Photobacterium kishitanii]